MAQQAARAQEIVMTGVYPVAPPNWFKGRLTRKINVRLTGCAAGLMLALLIAPGSRRLFLAQAGMTVPTPANIASVAGSQLGVRPDPYYGSIATPAAHAAARRFPDDLQVQIADACTVALDDGFPTSRSERIVPSVQKVQRLRALEGRFGDQPSLYANILRYAAMESVHPQHEAEQYDLAGSPPPAKSDKKAPSPAELAETAALYASYDHDAAQGERLDPDNAYFPFMRAVGLFGTHHDEEAVTAVVRAAHKPRWQEYYNDELRGQWKLQDAASVNNSALLHTVSAAALLFPQYAQMRGAVRVTIYKAMQAEQAGRVREGLTLREDVTRLGNLMRVESSNVIGAIVGDAITDNALVRPGGAQAIPRNYGSDEKERQHRAALRAQFDAYLERTGATDAVASFHAAQQAGDKMRDILQAGENAMPFDRPLHSLLHLWTADLLALSNILWLLIAGGLAALAGRGARNKAGLPLLPAARLGLTGGLVAGALAAPFLGLAPWFHWLGNGEGESIWMLPVGAALIVLALPAPSHSDHLRRVTAFGCGLPIGIALAGFCVWQSRGLGGILTLSEIYLNLSDQSSTGGPALTANLLWLTPCVCGLILLGLVAMSRVCRVPLSVGVTRGFPGLMVPVSAALFLIYGVMLLFTIRTERSVQYGLERSIENGGQAIADLSGAKWPRSGVVKKRVTP